MKSFKWVIIVALAGVCLYLADCLRDNSVKYRLMKKQYEEAAEAAALEHAAMLKRVDTMAAEIAERDKRIAGLEVSIAQNVSHIRTLEAALQDLRDNEPVQPELESEPLVINLRAQIGKLNNMFSLATNTITLQNQEIDELKGKVKLWEGVAAEWKAAYESEHALRVAAEEMFRFREKQTKIQKWTLRGLAAAGVAYGLLK